MSLSGVATDDKSGARRARARARARATVRADRDSVERDVEERMCVVWASPDPANGSWRADSRVVRDIVHGTGCRVATGRFRDSLFTMFDGVSEDDSYSIYSVEVVC